MSNNILHILNDPRNWCWLKTLATSLNLDNNKNFKSRLPKRVLNHCNFYRLLGQFSEEGQESQEKFMDGPLSKIFLYLKALKVTKPHQHNKRNINNSHWQKINYQCVAGLQAERTVYYQDSKSSQCLFPALLYWFKLVYGSFQQSNLHRTLVFSFCKTSQEGFKYVH